MRVTALASFQTADRPGRPLSAAPQAVAALSLCASATRARLALSTTAGEELIAQAQRKTADALDAAREIVVAKMTQT